jgi:multiple sugar transport system permease protein
MAVTSLKTDRELYNLASIPLLIGEGITLEHYSLLFNQTHFASWFINSLIISSLVTIISVFISTIAAYSLVRLRFRGSNVFGMGIFISYLVPSTLLFIPLSQVVSSLGLIDSIWALVVTYPTFVIPFCTWLLMSYFKSIPRELEECAMVDGATRLQALIKIVLPVAIPGVIAVTLFSFTLSWGEFIYGLTFISSSLKKPISVGVVSELVRGDVFFWGSLMAGALLASVPVIVVYSFFTEYFVSGLTAGATKY